MRYGKMLSEAARGHCGGAKAGSTGRWVSLEAGQRESFSL
jgi:hypothetical protein